MRTYIENEKGDLVPVPLDEAVEYYGRDFGIDKRRVALTKIGDREVSTVFLVFDHAFMGGKPVLYETMVFSQDDSNDSFTRRYHTRDQAVLGHEEVVKEVTMSSDGGLPLT